MRQPNSERGSTANDLDWGAFTHAAHVPQSKPCNYYVRVSLHCTVCVRTVITSILQSRLEFYLPAHHYSVVVLSLCNHLVYMSACYVEFVDGSNVHCFHCAFIVYGQLVICPEMGSYTCTCIYPLHLYSTIHVQNSLCILLCMYTCTVGVNVRI